MNEQQQQRRKKIATLTVVVPVLAGLVIVALGHFLGHESSDIAKPREATEVQVERRTAPVPAAAGTPAPRVRLSEGATGKRFDSASLGSEPYAVVFVSTRCEAIGDYLARVAKQLGGPDSGAVLAISGDPAADTPKAVNAWLAKHHLARNGPLRYLVGDEDELRGFWNAWGFTGPSSECPASTPAHLVNASGENTGVIDLEPDGPAAELTGPLTGQDR